MNYEDMTVRQQLEAEKFDPAEHADTEPDTFCDACRRWLLDNPGELTNPTEEQVELELFRDEEDADRRRQIGVRR